MINKAGNLRRKNGENRTHAVQVKRLDPACGAPFRYAAALDLGWLHCTAAQGLISDRRSPQAQAGPCWTPSQGLRVSHGLILNHHDRRRLLGCRFESRGTECRVHSPAFESSSLMPSSRLVCRVIDSDAESSTPKSTARKPRTRAIGGRLQRSHPLASDVTRGRDRTDSHPDRFGKSEALAPPGARRQGLKVVAGYSLLVRVAARHTCYHHLPHLHQPIYAVPFQMSARHALEVIGRLPSPCSPSVRRTWSLGRRLRPLRSRRIALLRCDHWHGRIAHPRSNCGKAPTQFTCSMVESIN
jgi:hypothetical protein